MKTSSDGTPAGAEAQPTACPCEPQPLPNMECVDRVMKLPLVEAACNQSAELYNNVKGFNSLLAMTLGTAEATVNKFVEHSRPVVDPIVKKLETPIGMVDKTLCKGLDVVESNIPCIKQEPAQIAENARTLCEPAIQQVKTLQELSWVTANQALKTNLGTAIVGGVDNFASTADRILDFILPPGEPLGIPRAEKVRQALVTIAGIPQRAAQRGYESMCYILQSVAQEDIRKTIRTILTLIQIQNLVDTMTGNSESDTSTPVNSESPNKDSKSQNSQPQASTVN